MSWPTSWLNGIARRLPWRDREAELEREIEAELRFHIELRAADNQRRGLPPDEARADALQRFGDYEQIKAACHEISRARLEKEIPMQAIKALTWAMVGVGLTLHFASDVSTVRQVGHILATIGILWRLLLYLRAVQRPHRHFAGGRPTLLVLSPSMDDAPAGEPTPRSIPARDQHGRTPVERLIADDE